jgi:hypothetical protein
MEISVGGVTSLIQYTNTGGVTIDVGNDGSIDQSFVSCLDLTPLQCPGN